MERGSFMGEKVEMGMVVVVVVLVGLVDGLRVEVKLISSSPPSCLDLKDGGFGDWICQKGGRESTVKGKGLESSTFMSSNHEFSNHHYPEPSQPCCHISRFANSTFATGRKIVQLAAATMHLKPPHSSSSVCQY